LSLVDILFGAALAIAGALAAAVGAWCAVTRRIPAWKVLPAIPAGRERWWGVAMIPVGVGGVTVGASGLFGPNEPKVWLAGVALTAIGAAGVLIAAPPRPAR
jgi:hypothetical protein